MQQLFNVSERFSKSLDDVRGPERKNHYLKKIQAWARPSGARRVAVRTLGYGGAALLFGTLGIALFRNRNEVKKVGSNIKDLIPISRRTPKVQHLGTERRVGGFS